METPRFRFGLALLVAFVHFLVFWSALAIGFGLGDGGRTVPQPLQVFVEILGAPLMLIFTDASKFNFIRHYLDDGTILMAIAAFNSVIWGIAIAFLIQNGQRLLSNSRWSGP